MNGSMKAKMSTSIVWVYRKNYIFAAASWLLSIVIIYLASELVIWGLSRLLASMKLEFFSAILGMALLFMLMIASQLFSGKTEKGYRRWMASKIDFINSHLGIGFPVPIVMIGHDHIIQSKAIARIVGNFVVTNLVSWSLTISISFALLFLAMGLRDHSCLAPTSPPARRYITSRSTGWHCGITKSACSNETIRQKCPSPLALAVSSGIDKTLLSTRRQSLEANSEQHLIIAPHLETAKIVLPMIVSFLSIFAVGVPISAAVKDDRPLDGCVLWFIWISCVRAQHWFKNYSAWHEVPRFKNALATAMNPVLVTTLLMMGYTRAKAAVYKAQDLADILRTFSSGTPLYAMWNAAVLGTTPPDNPAGWFGAGDAALTILECGILIWGFKLFECRKEIFSVGGLVTIVICVASAAGNVFLSVLSGRAMGLGPAVALAFAGRSTTLALAKPAMEAVGGDVVVNAALVVSNGTLGQLMYPFAIGKLGVQTNRTDSSTPDKSTLYYEGSFNDKYQLDELRILRRRHGRASDEMDERDSAVTIATGIAVGINGAAMGVSYLYEMKSRAAPYAALSMAVFGLMTVIFTSVEPFRSALLDVAEG